MKPVALLGMPFLFQSGDVDFHLKMVRLGLQRGSSLLCGGKHKAIIANRYEYFLTDYDDENAFCERYDLTPTYTIEDFVKGIENLKKK